MSDIRLCLTTCPDVACAERIASVLLERHLIGCANIVPGVTALYRWQGANCRESEVQLWLKTLATQMPALEQALHELHPYSTPAFIVLAAGHVAPAYAQWLQQQCEQGPAS